MNSKIVRDALASLDGKKWKTREDVEDSIFPLFGPLTAIFNGESYRDLVDRLIRARWLEYVKGEWNLVLPTIEKFGTANVPANSVAASEAPPVQNFPGTIVNTSAAFETEVALTLEDLTTLNTINKPGIVMTPSLQKLIDLGLVAQGFSLTTKGQNVVANAQNVIIKV